MFIKFKIVNSNYLPYYKYQVYKNARYKILNFRTKSVEAKLNKYLVANYGTNLKLLCLKIINNARFLSDLDDNIIVKIENKELEKLAQLITYGNGQVGGSQILVNAFRY